MCNVIHTQNRLTENPDVKQPLMCTLESDSIHRVRLPSPFSATPRKPEHPHQSLTSEDTLQNIEGHGNRHAEPRNAAHHPSLSSSKKRVCEYAPPAARNQFRQLRTHTKYRTCTGELVRVSTPCSNASSHTKPGMRASNASRASRSPSVTYEG